MRPRRARLGCYETVNFRAARFLRFNEAEARAPRMLEQAMAQKAAAGASMRPRRARLGCVGVANRHGVGINASMRPRRARLGCSHPTSPWTPRQYRRVFDRWRSATSKGRLIPQAIILTMSKSSRFQQSRKIRAAVEFRAAYRRSKAPGRWRNAFSQPCAPFSESRAILSDPAI